MVKYSTKNNKCLCTSTDESVEYGRAKAVFPKKNVMVYEIYRHYVEQS